MNELTVPEEYGFDEVTETAWNWLEQNPDDMREARTRAEVAETLDSAAASLSEMFDNGFSYTRNEMLQGTLYTLLLTQAYEGIQWKWIAFALREGK